MKVALVAGTAAPYRLPVWEALGQRLELDVILCSETESNRVWTDVHTAPVSYRRVVLPGVHRFVPGLDWGFHWNPSLVNQLRELRPDALILSGYDTPSYIAAILFARRKGIPVVLSVEGHGLSSRITHGPIAIARRLLVRSADACLAHGRAGAAHLAALGVAPQRIITGILPVDVTRYGRIADEERRGIEGRARFLYVGQLIERKGIMELLAAFAEIDAAQASLTIVGHGPLQAAVEDRLRQPGYSHVHYAGISTTVEQTARHYANADVMVMPSLREVWGLVVNEALAAGLYVLSARVAGATPDLIEDAPLDVGKVIDPANKNAMVSVLKDTATMVRTGVIDHAAIARWGRRHTPDKLAEKMVAAVQVAADHRRS